MPSQVNTQPAMQRGRNELVKYTGSMNLCLLSRQAPFSPAIAHCNTGVEAFSFRQLLQLDENSVKLWNSLPKGKMERDGRMKLEIAEVSEQLDKGSVKLWNDLPKKKMGGDGGMKLEIAKFQR
ncbi:hypothetical protein L3X38_009529 [Prunus dulcis]|uniref:Uncharacterized protein n=1 Tax=Prunus dulcis TaxID=3755 RepID=A0AAD4WE00_PRUDU|nr:hypothetical protein L3X38_009529 [Prunus dulcis]